MVESYLEKLRIELNLDPLFYQLENNQFLLAIPDTPPLVLISLTPGLNLWTQLGPMPTKGREDMLIYLMKANFLEQGTARGTLGINPEKSEVTFSMTLPFDLSFLDFKESLEEFLNFSEYWRGELQKTQSSIL